MASRYKDKDAGVVLSFNGQWVTWTHTVLGYGAFVSALVVGLWLHYEKIVKNEFYGYPEEWFPSVSAAIGDRYPGRNFYMLFMAVVSGPRFSLNGLWYLLTRRPGHTLPKFVASMGAFRTLTCCGWTYITSTDNHDWHDILMISYLVATLPWMTGCIALSPPNPRAIRYRKYLAAAYFGVHVPMVYYYIQHKVHRVAGAYTIYSFYEWSLVLFDVAFDAVTALDFERFEISIRDTTGSSMGLVPHEPALSLRSETSTSVPSIALEKENGQATGEVSGDVSSLYFTWPAALDTAADVYHGFMFWSILTSLGVVVWYFPLWHMGISGFEVLIMVTMSPALLGIQSVRSAVFDNLRIVHLLSLSAIAAYLVVNETIRLFAVGIGLALACIGWVATLYTESIHEARFESKLLGLMAGLILSSTVKFAWQTNNPVWPIMHAANGGWNGTGLIIGIFAALRFTRKAPLTKSVAPVGNQDGSPILAAFGVGGLMFGLHSLLSDTSTMILWVWEGYPLRGPDSATHGWCTVAAMSAGLFIGIWRPGVAGSWVPFALGTAGATVLTLYHHWFGYYGGLVLAVYLMAASVPLLSNAARKNPTVTFGLGFTVYNFVVLFHVWVVAYAFVPGGPAVRERTDWVMMTMMAMIGAGVYDYNTTPGRPNIRRSHQSQHRKQFGIATLVVNVLFLCAAFKRFPTNDHQPYHPEERILTAGIWTIHFSLDNFMWSSEYRMRDLIKEMELDVVGLLESDLQRIIMGNRDTTQFLAEDLGMYVDYGPGPNKHTWGAALLSKFPIVWSQHHLLPSPVGELAPAIHATLDVYGRLVDVFVFHSGQEEDEEDRRLQSEYMAKLMGSTPRPAILLSYLVTKPLEGNYNTYVGDVSGMHDVDPSDSDRWCEYILFRALKRVGYARVSRGSITDTELQAAKFVVPAEDDVWGVLSSKSAELRYNRVEEGDVPEGWRFPEVFKGRGVRGHRYHVLKDPRYFN